ncbi:hypothetical protein FIV42_27700 [Persicimonas caeni]|uniref:Uncharacterized protein n=1 Tax=Persicimonas caeni TaxID=2292766 RepID=A0A4Y6Q1J4_PERCE|nr:hypothetical protein [Persicimonas caeni]QDG54392.1 hypothetical protein FIV42_27700 [Persicimonas caeni]QED35613.1 hypothetical protein FRD00_27695 [Persicimonas caeni]
MIGIEISDEREGVLVVELPDLLACIDDGEQLFWSILYFEAVGDLSRFGTNVLELERAARESPTGVEIEWDMLLEMAGVFHQIVDIVLIGCRERQQIRQYRDDAEMYDTCRHVVELVDTSFALVHSQDKSVIECLHDRFEDVKLLDHP